jgi:hypothetical protein
MLENTPGVKLALVALCLLIMSTLGCQVTPADTERYSATDEFVLRQASKQISQTSADQSSSEAGEPIPAWQTRNAFPKLQYTRDP